ncbi:NAD(P)-dependent alcohol dehydrogenase [Planococcus sp. CP5-4]|uniref:NAD(P)-dependent alcohol dehydrogenase n=1 Tax=unclassified Planococcus (in: firmicutes) TaxID=2662419 RepID=UPI001C24F8E0|nr:MULTISPECIES: NAD(P)-dependent alcohol dehydrogenase [unclassified Planococcus (in: firmicutes)]MBU9673797.1 NAD(P)-dependent alcohol dehydrogenase [Planococcus sp. CP5-4_YE]MBV0908925.1 NAD(P)-dependent alcohol dehydrogenase [Planococcus sp. CP5-4_UN]MBW6063974.1 NAD(P)-dependent alcohol dehydrogenase [Planococcus sp. CP5-4]
MKAMVCTRYGTPDRLELQELEQPLPKANEISIKVLASTVTAGDCEMRSFTFPLYLHLPMRLLFGVRKPRMKVLGQEFAGVVEAVGESQKHFKKGDRVVGSTGMKLGANAEYVCLPERYAIVHMPKELDYEQAATIPTGGMNALFFLRKANIQAGQKVLILGAGGSIGTIAVQLAKHAGAEVTAIDRQEKLDMLLSIGADKVIDYERENFTASGETYDAIFDIVGKNTFSQAMGSLKPTGIYLIGNPSLGKVLRKFSGRRKGAGKVFVGVADYKADDLRYLVDLSAKGKLTTVIDRTFPLEELAQAHHYVESGMKKGNVVIVH